MYLLLFFAHHLFGKFIKNNYTMQPHFSYPLNENMLYVNNNAKSVIKRIFFGAIIYVIVFYSHLVKTHHIMTIMPTITEADSL